MTSKDIQTFAFAIEGRAITIWGAIVVKHVKSELPVRRSGSIWDPELEIRSGIGDISLPSGINQAKF